MSGNSYDHCQVRDLDLCMGKNGAYCVGCEMRYVEVMVAARYDRVIAYAFHALAQLKRPSASGRITVNTWKLRPNQPLGRISRDILEKKCFRRMFVTEVFRAQAWQQDCEPLRYLHRRWNKVGKYFNCMKICERSATRDTTSHQLSRNSPISLISELMQDP
ncbi:hypothetical protein CR513_47213, partial [Mucuna pruriens]